MKKLIALLLAVMMVMALCACGSKDEAAAAPAAPAAPAAAPDAAAPGSAPAAPAGDASGEPSGEASAPPDVEAYLPDRGNYSKDFEGFRQYCKDGFMADKFHPAELEESTLAEFDAMTEADYASGDRYVALTGLGVILTYDAFLAY